MAISTSITATQTMTMMIEIAFDNPRCFNQFKGVVAMMVINNESKNGTTISDDIRRNANSKAIPASVSTPSRKFVDCSVANAWCHAP